MESTWQNGPALALDPMGVDGARLRAYPVTDLWGLWWRVGAALAVAAALAVRRWVALSRQRVELKELDSRLLKDIGVTEQQAGKEARKPFWIE